MSKEKKLLEQLNKSQEHLDKLRNYMLRFTKRNSEGEAFINGQIAEQQMFVNGIALAARILGICLKSSTTHEGGIKTVWSFDKKQ